MLRYCTEYVISLTNSIVRSIHCCSENSGHFDTPRQDNVLHGVKINQRKTGDQKEKSYFLVLDLSGYLNAKD